MKKIYPAPLSPGDTIGIIAPSGPVDREQVRRGVNFLEEMGFNIKRGKNLFLKKSYLAGDDKARAEDLMEMFIDKDVKGIISARGGYGCLRILRYIDFKVIENNPKFFCGYSDISILLNSFYMRTGLITFHAPMLRQVSEGDRLTIKVLKQFLFESPKTFTYTTGTTGIKTVKTGSAEGPLIGGCLSVIISTIGTEYEPPWDGAVFFFEDIDEPLYRLDRMLTQLKLSGRLQKLKGIICGRMKGIKSSEISALLSEILEDLPIPAIINFPAGHQLPNLTLPIGATVKLEADLQRLSVDLNG